MDVAVRVFGDYDGIIYDDPQHEDQAEHGHHIQGNPKTLHQEKGTGERDRDPQGGHPGNAEIEKDAEDHQYQGKAGKTVSFERIEPIVDVHGKVIKETQVNTGWKTFFILSDELPDAPGNGNGIASFFFAYGEVNGRLAIETAKGCGLFEVVSHPGHLGYSEDIPLGI